MSGCGEMIMKKQFLLVMTFMFSMVPAVFGDVGQMTNDHLLSLKGAADCKAVQKVIDNAITAGSKIHSGKGDKAASEAQ